MKRTILQLVCLGMALFGVALDNNVAAQVWGATGFLIFALMELK